MLAKPRVDDNDQGAKEEAEQATYGGGTPQLGRLLLSEEGLCSRQEPANCDSGRQKACGEGCALENNSGEDEGRIHAPSVADSDAQMARKIKILSRVSSPTLRGQTS